MKEEKDVIKACEVAAKWWSDKLGTAAQNMGKGYDFANLLMGIVSMKNSPNNEKREKFYELLKQELIETLKVSNLVMLDTDYGPRGVLASIARECEIDGYAFPCKTYMHVREEKVVVREGYGADEKVIYVKENTVTDNTENKI